MTAGGYSWEAGIKAIQDGRVDLIFLRCFTYKAVYELMGSTCAGHIYGSGRIQQGGRHQGN